MPLRRFACALVAVALLFAGACTTPEVPYDDQIANRRTEIDRFMRESPQSPIVADKRATFPPLAYFPTNAEYRVPAALNVNVSDEILEMPTSTGQRRKMVRIGSLEFTLRGQPHKLTAFADATDKELLRLFVPFSDRTSGTETYPGGRYLDLDRTATGIYDLDFNRAYHPYCLYNPTYDCPIPPRENRLPVPIRAGERLPSP